MISKRHLQSKLVVYIVLLFKPLWGFMMKGQKKKQINEHCHFLLFPPSGRKDLFKYIQITKLLAFPSAPINDALIQLLFVLTHWREMLVLRPTTLTATCI